jgi:hypothetical protein
MSESASWLPAFRYMCVCVYVRVLHVCACERVCMCARAQRERKRYTDYTLMYNTWPLSVCVCVYMMCTFQARSPRHPSCRMIPRQRLEEERPGFPGLAKRSAKRTPARGNLMTVASSTSGQHAFVQQTGKKWGTNRDRAKFNTLNLKIEIGVTS